MKKIRLLIARYEDNVWRVLMHRKLHVSSLLDLEDRIERYLDGYEASAAFRPGQLAYRVWHGGNSTQEFNGLAVFAHRLAAERLPVPLPQTPVLPEPSQPALWTRELNVRKLRQAGVASVMVAAGLLLAQAFMPEPPSANYIAEAACPSSAPDYVAYVEYSMTAEEWEKALTQDWTDKASFGAAHYRNHGFVEGRQMKCQDYSA
jgi:hypothetical protein